MTDFYRTLSVANRMHLQIRHFTRQKYHLQPGPYVSLPVNRFLMPIGGEKEGEHSFIRDSNATLRLERGKYYFIPIYHPAMVCLSKNMLFISIQFTLDFQNGVDLFSNVNRIAAFEDKGFLERAEEICRNVPGEWAAAQLRSLTMEFAAGLMKYVEPEELRTDENFTLYFRELESVRRQCLASTTVEELAELCGTGRDVFSRNFIRKNGISPKQFLNRCVLYRAFAMLSDGDRLIRDIAMELGFANEFYFSRFFKKHTGVPPKAFRQRYRRI